MFLDTSGLMCLFDVRERRHPSAIQHYDAAEIRITHNYVLAEFVALAVARHAPLVQALQFISTIGATSEIKVRWVDQDLHNQALQLLRDRADKLWSLCDAVSFVTMEDESVRTSLTTDHHFEQAGFIRLLDS